MSTLSLSLKLVLATQILFDAATSLTKLSMLTLTYRIIGSGSALLRNVIIGVMSVVVLQGTIFMFIVIFQCGHVIRSRPQTRADNYRPPSQYWTLSFTPQSCILEPKTLLVSGIINTISDFLIVILPIPTVWRLRLPSRQQVILGLLFGAGFIVSAAGCVRTVYTYRLTVSNDRTWMASPAWLSSSVELYLGIVNRSYPE